MSTTAVTTDDERAYADVLARSQRQGPIRVPADLAYVMEPIRSTLAHERAWLGAVNAAGYLAELRELDRGTRTSVAVCQWSNCADVAAAAVKSGEVYALLVHNHPSGFAWPSVADADLTRAVSAALSRRRVLLLDHVILGRHELYSFHEQRVIPWTTSSRTF